MRPEPNNLGLELKPEKPAISHRYAGHEERRLKESFKHQRRNKSRAAIIPCLHVGTGNAPAYL